MAKARTGNDEGKKPAGRAEKAAYPTEKSAGQGQKSAGQGQKSAGRGQKSAGQAQKSAGRGQKSAGQAQKSAGRGQKSAGGSEADGGADQADDGGQLTVSDAARKGVAALRPLALVAPERTGRAPNNLEAALQAAEIRLLLGFMHRDELDPLLPSSPPFHAHAWSALRLLGGKEDDAGQAGTPNQKTSDALERLAEKLLLLRAVVNLTTKKGDSARDELQSGTIIKAQTSLVDLAPQIIAGARRVRGRFPALSDELLKSADAALEEASKAVGKRRLRKVDDTVKRADSADEQQLALDVLLDSIDHLRAAALVGLSASRPRLAAVLTAPLEISHGKVDDEPLVPVQPPAVGATPTNQPAAQG